MHKQITNHDQLYAQLIDEIERGERYNYTKEEEREMQQHNERYYVPDQLELLFQKFFRAPADDEEHCQRLTAKQLMSQLARHNSRLMNTVSETAFGKMLTRLGIPKVHAHDTNYYRIVVL